MLKVYYTNKIKKDLKLLKKRNYKFDEFVKVIDLLLNEKVLPEKYKDHALSGNYHKYRECHIEPDWLLIYRIESNILTLVLARSGTHSDLFKSK